MRLRRVRNPTPLAVGAKGLFEGRQAMITGWAALQSADGYRWDEYQAVFADRSSLLLVFERGVWKRFVRFTPRPPMTRQAAVDASLGRMTAVGDELFRVTYVGTSRVLAASGDMPPGYGEGQRDAYFNAESHDEMVVVTWTDDELGCYRGRVLRQGTVEGAFNLPLPGLFATVRQHLMGVASAPGRLTGAVMWVAICLLVASSLLERVGVRSPTIDPPPPLPLARPELALERRGVLGGHTYRIAGHRVVRIDDLAGEFSRHEYDLVDEQGRAAVLVEALDRDPRQWALLEPAEAPVNPYLAATLTPRSHLQVNGAYTIVRRLFRGETLQLDGSPSEHERLGEIRYGFEAENKTGPVLARWTAVDIEFLAGRNVPEADVTAAFGPLRAP